MTQTAPQTTTEPEPLSKTYLPAQTEPTSWQRWINAQAFKADPARVINGEADPYCILIPPPNVTAALHLGHALNNTIQDILIRAHRMKGFETLWMPGTDHAGIATQTVVDKRLKEAGEPALADYKKIEHAGGDGQTQFVAKVQAFKDEYEQRITEQLMAMGCSCDWDRQRFTMDDVCARAVREAFFQLFKDGLIYRGKRLVNWDPVTQTALADDEVENQEVEGAFYYLRYPLVHPCEAGNHSPVTWSELATRGYPEADKHPEDEHAWVTVATTRPETYLGDTAVALNKRDPRAASLKGLLCELPLVGRRIPIIEDDYVVLPVKYGGDPADPKAEMATGFLKVTPAHDPNDWELGQRHADDIMARCSAGEYIINVMAPDASVSKDHGWVDFEQYGHDSGAEVFIGLSREDARQKVCDEFKARSMGEGSLLEAIKPHTHSVGHSYRSHAAIEPYLSDQWYCRVTDDKLRGNAQRALKSEQRSEKSLEAWPESAPSYEPRPSGSGQDSSSYEPRPSGSGQGQSYLITFTTYGTWLHGDDRGSADRDQNLPGTPYIDPNAARESVNKSSLKHGPVKLTPSEIQIVADTIQEVCSHRGWTLHTCNVRTNHVHVVISSDAAPEKVMNDLKAYATRRIKEQLGIDRENTWTRHGSTRYLNTPESFEGAIRYVRDEQGKDLGGTRFSPLPHGRGSSETNPHDGKLKFYPDRYAKTYEMWHDNLRDWCISRQLWWGHRIPVWVAPLGTTVPPEITPEIGCPRESETQVNVCLRSSDPSVISSLEAAGFTHDPDVLDTWFSSALWPMSTMGWPDAEAAKSSTGIEDFPALLEAFNPSSVLTTAREIITLWVSRMVMFNRYFLGSKRAATIRERAEASQRAATVRERAQLSAGQLPFRDVFIHAMIQDGEGRKMSKSLGNGVDPLDIIHSHGADAMRFTLCQMTTQTQDVRMPVEYDEATGKNTSPKFDAGRNFCNKLWNAARFTLMMLEDHSPVPQGEQGLPISLEELSLTDRWMLSRLAATTTTINAAMKNYQFKEYADALYDLLWRDFCDWYLEAIKPTLGTDPNQPAVLRLVFDSILRLLHPVTPFITEEIHDRFSRIPARQIEGVGFAQTKSTETLCQSGWPQLDAGVRDEVAEIAFERAKALVSAIREVRAKSQVQPRRKITLHASAALAADVERWSPLIQTLAGVEAITTDTPEGAAGRTAAFTFEGTEHQLSNLADALDAGAEKERLAKQLDDLGKSISGLEGRLNNPGYVDKAPPALVEQTRKQLEDLKAERQSVADAMSKLG